MVWIGGNKAIKWKVLLQILMLSILFFNPAVLFCREPAPPLLLSLDVEHDSDVEALQSLNIKESATYFITGEFARKFPKVTNELSLSGTIGSHSHSHPNLTELSLEEVRRDLAASAEAIEAATGFAPVWFRAPFLGVNENILSIARDLGFRYDSSESERWVQQQVLSEFPISINDTGRVLFSDYDFFSGYGFDDIMTLDLLKENYLNRFKTGRPFVFLLHPRIIAEHKEVLHQFISFVKEQGGSCLSFGQYLEQIQAESPGNRVGVRIDLSLGRLDINRTLSDLVKTQVTDVFILSRDKTGRNYYAIEGVKADSIEAHFSQLVQGLHDAGIRVHGWIPVLYNTTSATKFPDQAMVDGLGQASNNWVSPAHPQTINNITQLVSDLLTNFPLAGIHLDDLAYPNLGFDYSLETLKKFRTDTGIMVEHKTAANELPGNHYNDWITWRSLQLSEIVKSIASTASKTGRDILLSASLKAESLSNFRTMELSGQNYRLLAEDLDMIVAVSAGDSGAEKTNALPRLITISRFQIGNKTLLIGLPIHAKTPPKETLEQLTSEVNLVRQGANGFLLSPYPDVFEHNRLRPEQLKKLTTLVDEFLHPSKAPNKPVVPAQMSLVTEAHASPGESVTPVSFEKEIKPTENNSTGTQVLTVISCLSLFAFLGFRFIRSRRFYTKPIPGGEKTDMLNWQKLDESICDDQISGELVHAVASHLRTYDPVSTSKYRMALVLDIIIKAPQQLSLNVLVTMAVDIPGWQVLAMSHLQEAVTHGYIKIDHDRLKVTPKGTEELQAMKAGGFDPAHWIFVEQRLHESLNASCPNCDEKNLTHWYWTNFTCTKCNQDINLWECTDISRRNPAIISLNQHYYA